MAVGCQEEVCFVGELNVRVNKAFKMWLVWSWK